MFCVSKKFIKSWLCMILITIFFLDISVFAGDQKDVLNKSKEMRGIWVATVYSLDYPNEPTTDPVLLKKQADLIIDNAKNLGMNAIFLQVRPSADAFYKSNYFPWSKYLTGKQGLAPENNFDPLKYWVYKAHKENLELHAWLNPFRITKNSDEEFNLLDDSNPAKLNPDWVVKYNKDKNYYFDPGIPKVRKLIIRGAMELVKKYKVDGIHLDDYFYPGKDFKDNKSFETYGKKFVNIDDFRYNNINKLIYGLNKKIHELNPNAKFGVSPCGIWANKKNNPNGSDTNGFESYSELYCDSRYWIKKNMIDYIAPQIYWNIGFKKADYKVLLDWWSKLVKDTKVKLYIGMADYRTALEKNINSVWYGTDEISRQLNLNKKNDYVSGEIHFRYKLLNDNQALNEFYKNYYKN